MLHRQAGFLAAIATLGLNAACTTAPPNDDRAVAAAAGAAACRTAEAGVQVLGSGGPMAEGSRAGTSYAVWIDGQVRLLVDAGPGSFVRFGEAGLELAPLEAIAFSHFHADHSAGLAAILNAGSFESSTRDLPVLGPAAVAPFPGTAAFLSAQFDRDSGAWAYLGGYLDGGDGRRKLVPGEIPAEDYETASAQRIELSPAIAITAIPVHHGVIPSLAYLVEAKGRTILFASDQSAFSTGFDRYTRGLRPDLLIAHHVIPEGEGQPIGLHRPPSSLAEMAAAIEPQLLVLSHNMQRSLDRLDESLSLIRGRFSGQVRVADDGDCFALPQREVRTAS